MAVTANKKPEKEATLDCNEFQDLWDAKLPEDQLSKKKKNKLIRERMLKKEVPKAKVTLDWNEFQDLWNDKPTEDQLFKKKRNEMIKEKMLKNKNKKGGGDPGLERISGSMELQASKVPAIQEEGVRRAQNGAVEGRNDEGREA